MVQNQGVRMICGLKERRGDTGAKVGLGLEEWDVRR